MFRATGPGQIEISAGFSGIGVLLLAWRKAGKGYYDGGGLNAYGMSAAVMYWHFVDVVWVFLFPLIYLVERHP